MRESCKKLLGILLAVIMAVTMIPIQGAAAEDKSTESAVQTDVAAAQELAGNTSEVTQDNGRKTPSYDINMPVIERFEFAENGQALTVNDKLHFKVWAYDLDSDIRSVDVRVECRGNGHGGSVRLEKSGEGNLYTGELSCKWMKGNEFYVYQIDVEDIFGNYVYGETRNEETGQPLYTFTLDYEDDVVVDNNVTVSNFRMQTNPSNADGKLRSGDTVTYTADVQCKDETILSCEAYVEGNRDYSLRSEWIDVSYDDVTQTLTGTFTVTDKTYPAEWHLEYFSVRTESGKSYYFYPSSMEPETDLSFEVVQEDFDTEPPVIESITVDKNGQFVKAGDVVNITVKVKEDHPREYAFAHFSHQVTNVSASTDVELKFNPDTSTYTGTIFITEDTYPCEWAFTDLWIEDENEHGASLYDFQQDYREMLPWYYKVKSGDTYREDFKAVTFDFYGYAKQADGSYQPNALISSQTVERVGRRTTLKDLGVSFPQPIEGVTTEWKYGDPWWGDESRGTVIDENTELLFNSTSDMTYSLTASYDKVCANVSLTYMTKDSGIKTVVLPQFVDKGVTYRDVLDALELPEDAETLGFTGLELSYNNSYHNDSTQVGIDENFSSSITAKAKYKNCQVAWKARYIGPDGKEVSKVINQTYLEGTKVSDALAKLELPENVEGLELESWILLGGDVEEISQSIASMDIVAVYQGKTTVDASYTYRGEDGLITTGGGMVLMDGVDLTQAEIEGAATDVFKEVNHFEGLRLSEWMGSIRINQPRYKKVEFQALYQNFVLTLKYPDGTSQHVVVDKGTQYMLPTENEKYKDIVWEGYTKGETVTVVEDMEFIVEKSTLKDGTEDGPKGIRLPKAEIEKIKEEIKNAKPGDTITVDMKKATVVPKEVLEEIKGKPLEIVLDMGEYSWTIGGTEVLATELRDIDLEVKIDANTIPVGIVSELAEGRPTTQLSLTHNGNFGFRADLTLNLKSENSGGTGDLYYYDSSGKLIFMNSGKIGEDGKTSLSFSHASDYVIVINKADAPDNDKKKNDKDGNKKKENSGNADIQRKDINPTTDSGSIKTDSTYRKSPKTGE